MNYPASARIDKDWLENQAADNPEWELVSTEINNDNYRDFFIGNGYIGQTVPPEGEGSWNIPELAKAVGGPRSVSGCQIHGFSDRVFLMDVPSWSGLRFSDGRSVYSRFNGLHENYIQTLNMRHGYVTTEVDWSSQEGPDRGRRMTHIKTTTWLSRAHRNLGVVKYEITPDYDGKVTFDDILDGSRCPEESCDWQTEDFWDWIISLSARMGLHKRKVLIASKVLTPADEERVGVVSDSHRCRTRRVTIPVEKGKTYTVTKLAAVYTDADGPEIETQASTLLYNAAPRIDGYFQDHCAAWEDLWKSNISCSHKGVQLLARSALYQLYAQLREGVHHSLGPAGITGLRQWSGRAFWDADLWIAPPVLMLHPELGKAIIAFRHKTLPGAMRNARSERREGARYAWESILTGDEICLGYTAQQIHNIGDVALTQWWYSLIAGDDEYTEKAEEVIVECARYFASRAEYNQDQDRYEIKAVCCADERSGIVDNNTYSNYSAIKTLRLASDILKKNGRPIPEHWPTIAEKLYLPYYDEIGTYREHDSYTDQTIKQADTTLLIYPYDLDMTEEEKVNAIRFYRGKYPKHKIMMSSAIDGVALCEINQPEEAWDCFLDLLPHFRLPCLHVSEAPSNETISFATGLGGMLQLILNGFGGIRITEEGLTIKPALPQAVESLTFTGIHCRGISFDLKISKGCVECCNFSAEPTFALDVPEGIELQGFPKEGFST